MTEPKRPSSLETCDQAPADRMGRWVLVVVLAAAAMIFAAGATSDITKGDEVYHASFARAWAQAGLLHRPVFNPIYESGDPPGYRYVSEVLWGAGLAALWTLTGVQAWVGQLYQVGWYALLLVVIYLCGRHLLGPRGGLAAMLIAVAVPMFSAFAVLLYVDVPGTALAAVALLAMLKRRYFWAGVVMGCAYLMKRNAWFLGVPFGLWLVVDQLTTTKGPWWQRLWRTAWASACFCIPMIIVVMPDVLWRRNHFGGSGDPVASVANIRSRLTTFVSPQKLPSSLASPVDLAAYLGPVLPLAALVYLVRRAWRGGGAQHAWLWLSFVLYMVIIVLVFTLDTDIRYAMPVVPVVILIVARGLRDWARRPTVLVVLALVALLGVAGTSWYTRTQRLVTPDQRAAFSYLRNQTPPGSLVMYPGEILIAKANRPVVWAHLIDKASGSEMLPNLLRQYDTDQIGRALADNRVAYVLIDRRTLYDATADDRVGFYPKQFLEKLERAPYAREIKGNWPSMALFRIAAGAVPPADNGSRDD